MKNTPIRKELVRVIKHLRKFGIDNCYLKRSSDYINVYCSNNQDFEHLCINETGIGVSELKHWINNLADTDNHFIMIDNCECEESSTSVLRLVQYRPISDQSWLNSLKESYCRELNSDDPLLAEINKTICSVLRYNKFELATALKQTVQQYITNNK